MYVILEHILSELHNRHPATGRDMYSTNDLDVILHNPMCPNSPCGVGHMVVCHGMLMEKRVNQ